MFLFEARIELQSPVSADIFSCDDSGNLNVDVNQLSDIGCLVCADTCVPPVAEDGNRTPERTVGGGH